MGLIAGKVIPLVRQIKSGRHLRGVARFLLPVCLLFAVLAPPASAERADLTEIAQLSRSGASELALSLLDMGQPSVEKQPAEWMRWERLRIRLLEDGEQWEALISRAGKLPEGLPQSFVEWAMLRQAMAMVHAGEYAASRRVLRELVWRAEPHAAGTQLAEYRHWLMQGYLREGRTADALAAMQRYQQDYGEGDQEALMLRARVLLAADRASEARSVLARMASHPEARVLRELAALRSGVDAKQVLGKLASLHKEFGDEHAVAPLLAGSLAEAAVAASDLPAQIVALQRYLALSDSQTDAQSLFSFSGDDLWQAWSAYAAQIGNQQQLLIGDDAAWLSSAEKTEAKYPVRQRSLYAMVALRGSSAANRSLAHQHLAGLLQQEEHGLDLLRQLYLNAAQTRQRNSLPEAVAYILVDQALRAGDLPLAATLMQQLGEPPSGTARFAWQMRRAKVFILAADFEAFLQWFNAMLPQLARLDAEQRDQMVHLLFDLQNVGEHQLAYDLLGQVYANVPVQSLRRELLFWMADSLVALERDVEAARLYLQSATLGDVNSMDPWAQTARYQAANSLSRAGLLQDARHIYRQLLRITESPERRVVLLRELEQIQMRLAAGGR